MEMNQPLDSGVNDNLELTSMSRSYLNETAGWAKFLAICGFVFLGLLVIMALSLGAIIGTLMPPEMAGDFPVGLVVAFYIFFAAIYFLPVLYLYRFSVRMKSALKTKDQVLLEDSLSNIKAHYKFIGILMIIMLGMYALGLIGALIMGAAL